MKLADHRRRSPLLHVVGLCLAVLAVASIPAALLLHGVNDSLFSEQALRRTLRENLVESGALRRLTVEVIFEQSDSEGDGFTQLTQDMEAGASLELTEIIVPDEWLQSELNSVVEQGLAWLDSDQPAPLIVLNLEPIKRNLMGAGSEEVVALVMASWPPCTQSELEQIATAALSAEGPIPVIRCLPPEPYQTLLRDTLILGAQQQAATMPESMRLGGDSAPSQGTEDYRELKFWLLTLRWLGRWGWMVSAALFGLTMAVVVRSPRDLALWWGGPLLAGGLLTLLLLLLVSGRAGRYVAALAAEFGSSEAMRRTATAVLADLTQRIVEGAFGLGLALALLGGLLTGVGLWLPRPRG